MYSIGARRVYSIGAWLSHLVSMRDVYMVFMSIRPGVGMLLLERPNATACTNSVVEEQGTTEHVKS